MFRKKFRVSNRELHIVWDYRSKQKAIKVARFMQDETNKHGPLNQNDYWEVHSLETGELIDY